MKRAGVIGWPVAHSLSPVLHGYWLKKYGIDGAYEKIPAAPEDFRNTIVRLQKEGFSGVNVTVPHKEAAFALADSHDGAAKAAGAANLLVFHPDGSLEGRNTDTIGFVESVKNTGSDLKNKTFVLVGSGGATRGAILASEQLGAATIIVLGRSEAKAKSLVEELKPQLKVKLEFGDIKTAWVTSAPIAGFVANTSSGGMTDHSPLNLDLELLRKDTPVLDIVYSPLQTNLLADAQARGNKTIDGLGMLMHQAVPSFEAFFGIRPDVTPGLRAALVEALGNR